MKLYDSLRRELVDFVPLDAERVTVYGCGPTVYDYAHIGNFRTFLVYDLLHRYLRSHGRRVEFVVNVTDVDDKTIEERPAGGCPCPNTRLPSLRRSWKMPKRSGSCPSASTSRATAFIPAMKSFIQLLIDRGHAYHAGDGSVYYSVSTFANYGRLSGSRIDSGAERSRINSDEYKKSDARDFVLWKAARPPDETGGRGVGLPLGARPPRLAPRVFGNGQIALR